MATGKTTVIDQPKSNVLQFINKEGSKVTVRPSGTEPKIKFYFSLKGELKDKSQFAQANEAVDAKIKSMSAELGL